MEFLSTIMKLEGSRLHGSITKRLPSNDFWTDAFGVAAYILFVAGVPLVRTNWPHIQDQIQASGASLFYGMKNTYQMTVRFEKQDGSPYFDPFSGARGDNEDSEEGRRNNILQKAILLYIGYLDLDYRRSLAFLSAVKQKPLSDDKEERGFMAERAPKVYGGCAEQLKRYNINVSPPEQIWVEVDKKDGVWFKQTKTKVMADKESGQIPAKVQPTTIEYTFRCAGPGGNAKVKGFIKRAYDWYTEQMESTEDNARYMYSLEPSKEQPNGRSERVRDPSMPISPSMGKEESSPLTYKRYKLGDLKNFNSLFFPEKDNLLKILGNFEAKRGKYALEGYPHKLGLLLHGPPGTGKTSLIKALACRTRRHIIQVPLGRIKTNQDLMNIMFDQSFSVVKHELPVPLKHKDVIYVFEDVDAASKIVKSRENIKTAGAPPPPASAGAPGKDDNATPPSGGKDEAAEDDKNGNEFDKLNLSGLLNVLDGVVDTPGRIVVVTTNLVDSLDPALIRPGRIDKKILLGYMGYEAALAMTKHFFPEEAAGGDLSREHKRRLKAVFSKDSEARRQKPTSRCGGADKGKLTPATVEQMLGEHDKVDDFLEALEGLAEEKEGKKPGPSVRDRVLLAVVVVFLTVRIAQKVYF